MDSEPIFRGPLENTRRNNIYAPMDPQGDWGRAKVSVEPNLHGCVSQGFDPQMSI